MLYECVTGQLPFDRDRLNELMYAIVRGPLVAPREIRPDVPADFEAVILRSMHRAPGRLFPPMRAFGEALLRFASPGQRALWEPVFDVGTHHRTFVTYDATSPAGCSATLADAAMPAADAAPTAPPLARPRRRAETERRVPVHAPPRALLAGVAVARALALVVIALGLRPAPAVSATVTASLPTPGPEVPTGLVALPPEPEPEARTVLAVAAPVTVSHPRARRGHRLPATWRFVHR
jgi:hypothetical protein